MPAPADLRRGTGAGAAAGVGGRVDLRGDDVVIDLREGTEGPEVVVGPASPSLDGVLAAVKAEGLRRRAVRLRRRRAVVVVGAAVVLVLLGVGVAVATGSSSPEESVSTDVAAAPTTVVPRPVPTTVAPTTVAPTTLLPSVSTALPVPATTLVPTPTTVGVPATAPAPAPSAPVPTAPPTTATAADPEVAVGPDPEVAERPAPDPCRNSADPACGPFRWDPAPQPDQPLEAQLSVGPARAGEPVGFTVTWSDGDAPLTYDRFAPDGVAVARPCSVDARHGPWTPPEPAGGSGSLAYTHTFADPGRYTVAVSLGTGDCASPYGTDATLEVTVVVV